MSPRGPRQHAARHFGIASGVVALSCLVPAAGAIWLGLGWPTGLLLLVAVSAFSLLAFAARIGRWMRAPIPFRIPLTVGQQQSLPSVHADRIGSPRSRAEVVTRVVIDALLFRPLWRSTPTTAADHRGLSAYSGRLLGLMALAFHGSMLIVLLRHLRLVLSPTPAWVTWLEQVDSVTELAIPKLHVSSLVLVVALGLLLGRRLVLTRMRYLSLAADYFPLLLLGAIATTGLLMRHIAHTDIVALKQQLGALAGSELAPSRGSTSTDALLLTHLFLVCVLIAYFPLSKLMHFPGALMSPTLTLANDNRERRHVNPCNPAVQIHTYSQYEAEFRERMIQAGIATEES